MIRRLEARRRRSRRAARDDNCHWQEKAVADARPELLHAHARACRPPRTAHASREIRDAHVRSRSTGRARRHMPRTPVAARDLRVNTFQPKRGPRYAPIATTTNAPPTTGRRRALRARFRAALRGPRRSRAVANAAEGGARVIAPTRAVNHGVARREPAPARATGLARAPRTAETHTRATRARLARARGPVAGGAPARTSAMRVGASHRAPPGRRPRRAARNRRRGSCSAARRSRTTRASTPAPGRRAEVLPTRRLANSGTRMSFRATVKRTSLRRAPARRAAEKLVALAAAARAARLSRPAVGRGSRAPRGGSHGGH